MMKFDEAKKILKGLIQHGTTNRVNAKKALEIFVENKKKKIEQSIPEILEGNDLYLVKPKAEPAAPPEPEVKAVERAVENNEPAAEIVETSEELAETQLEGFRPVSRSAVSVEEAIITCYCGEKFKPVDTSGNLIKKEKWVCQGCEYKHPNLLRHARAFANLLIIVAIVYIVQIVMINADKSMHDESIFKLMSYLELALLVFTIVCIYLTKWPWKNKLTRIMVWLVLLDRLIVVILLYLSKVRPELATPTPFYLHLSSFALLSLFAYYLWWIFHQAPKRMQMN
jgi:hypothetical protein